MRSKEENEFFESRMAITLSLHPELFPSVQLISGKILDLIEINREKFISIFREKPEDDHIKAINSIKSGLYRSKDRGPLGGISKSTEGLSIEKILTDIEQELRSAKTLMQIMPIHAAFGYYIGRLLDETAYLEIKELLESLTPKVTDCKKLKAKDEKIILTDQFGISNSPIYCGLLNASHEAIELKSIIDPFHRNSLQRYTVNLEHPALKAFIENNAPLAAGPSSHAITILTAARLYQKVLGHEFLLDMQYEYSMAYFSYLATAGYHTFHEVMSVAAKCTNRPYDISNYQGNIPPYIYDFIKSAMPELTEETLCSSEQNSSDILLVFNQLSVEQPFSTEPSSSSGYVQQSSPLRPS